MSGPRSLLGSVLSAALTASGLAVVLVGASAPAADAASPTPVCDANGQCTVTFDYTGAVQTWTVPVGVTSITATVEGAGVQVSGVGGGGRSTGTVPVVSGAAVTVIVGGQDGFGGGGAGGASVKLSRGARGSGGSFLAIAGDLVLAAGGGGGIGFDAGDATPGGAGGGAGAPATDGALNGTAPGKAATATAHGAAGGGSATAGSGDFTIAPSVGYPQGGKGGDSEPEVCVEFQPGVCRPLTDYPSVGGAGGGGGFRAGGGAAGGSLSNRPRASGGGGGSGYAAPSVTNVSGAAGVINGNGRVVLAYTVAPSISITTTGCQTIAAPRSGPFQVVAVGSAGAAGSNGGAAGGAGDAVSATVSGVASGASLFVCVNVGGGQPSSGSFGAGGAGGGASLVSLGADGGSPVVVAGGGGGGSRNVFEYGGSAGYPSGSDSRLGRATGGSQSAPGTGGAGTSGTGIDRSGPGRGGNAAPVALAGGGGGGAGYYGGGGGALTNEFGNVAGGGGGGSDFCGAAGGASVSGCVFSHEGTKTTSGAGLGEAKVFLVWPKAAAPTVMLGSVGSGPFAVGQKVVTSFSCAASVDLPNTTTSCTDSHGGSGTSGVLDTSTLGAHTYTVTARGVDGQTATSTVSYQVRGTVPVTVTGSQSYGSGAPVFVATPSGALPSGLSVASPVSCTRVDGGTAISPTLTSTTSHTIDAGSCSVTLSGAGAADYDLVITGGAFTVRKGMQAISGLVVPDAPRVGDSTALTAVGGGSGQPVTYSSSSTACSISGSTVSFVHVGTCAVTASQAGTTEYDAASDVTVSTTVTKRLQSISFSLPSAARVGDSAVLSGTASSGGAVSYTAGGGAGVCRIAGGSVVFDHRGACTVTASQAGSDDVAAAPDAVQTVQVGKGLQSISFSIAGPNSVGDARNLTATGGASGQPVTYAIGVGTTNDACVIVSGRVVFRHAGSCVVTADQAGTDDYEPAATATQTVTVGKGDPQLSFTFPASAKVGESLVVVASSSSPQRVDVVSQNPEACTVDGLTVTFVHAGVGACTLAVSQATSDDYLPASRLGSIEVVWASQAITGFAPASSASVGGAPVDLSASGGGSGNPVTFAVSGETTNGACTISGATVSFVHAGSCVVTADQAGNTDYTAAVQVKRTITVGKASQVITASTFGAFVYGSTTAGVSASGGVSGSPVTAAASSSVPDNACTVSGFSVSFTGVGTCTIVVSQAGNDDYTAAPAVVVTRQVSKAAQVITGMGLPTAPRVGDTFALTTAGGGSGNPVQYEATDGVCSVSGSTLSFDHVGRCEVTFFQPGTALYADSARTTLGVGVGQKLQTLTFSLPSASAVGQRADLSGSSSAGLRVGYVAGGGTGVCRIDGASVVYEHPGTCVVTASQAGTTDVAAASSVVQSVVVGKGAQAIAFTLAGQGTVGGSRALSATGGASSAPLVFAVGTGTTNNACSITTDATGSRLSFDHAGVCAVSADQAGDTDYEAAAQVTQSVTVVPAGQSITGFVLPDSGAVGSSAALSGSGGASRNPVRFSVAKGTSNGACSISGSTVSFDHAGTCVVAADQAGTADYEAAPTVFRTIAVGRASQSITGFSLPATASLGGSAPLVATGGGSGQSVVFSVDPATTNGACVIDGAVVRFVHAGSCVVAAFQGGTADFEEARALATVTIQRAATTTSVSVTSTQVRALVRSTDAGLGTPSGQVQFLVDGVLLGTAALSDAGVAVLDAVVPAGEHLVMARYLGDGDFAAGVGDYATSSGEVVRTDPVITATITSARAISASGWYRSPVTVSFACTAGTGALVGACPSPVVIGRSTKGRTVTGTVLADDGGRATVTTEVVKVDLVKPKVRITGISAGHPRCVAKDRTSGVDSCRLKVRTHRDRVVYVAIAKDVAGNTSKVRKTVRR